MPRPTTNPEWDTTAVNMTAPTTEDTVGWGVSQAPSAQLFNWHMHWVWKFIEWLDEREQALSAVQPVAWCRVTWNLGAPVLADPHNVASISSPSGGTLSFTLTTGTYTVLTGTANGGYRIGISGTQDVAVYDTSTEAVIDFGTTAGFVHIVLF